MVDPTLSSVVLEAFSDMASQLWLVIPAGLTLFGIIYGIGRAKKAAKTAAA